MSDPNLFLVDVEIFKKRYRHLGILGRGKDPYLEIYSTINIVEDYYTQQRRAIQVFQNLSQELYTRKLDQLYKSAYMFYVSFHLPILAFSYKKNDDKTYDVYVLYDYEKQNITLEDKIQEKKQQKTPFTQEELWNMTFLLIDSMYMGSRLSLEYLDINPYNIYYVADEPQLYFISNFGLQLHKKFEKRLYCPSDRFYNSQSKPQDRAFEQYISSYMFQVGMMSLYMASLQDPNELYNDIFGLETKTLNQEKLKSRLESIKQKVSEKYFIFLNALLQVKEEKRINIEELMNTSEGQNLLERQKFYYQGELPDAKMYSGFVTRVQDQEQVPHGIGDIFTDNDQYYKGSFQNGSIHGYGIWYDGIQKYAHGRWENDELKQGYLIQKNQYIFYGHISDFNPGGIGVLFSLSSNTGADYFYYNGQFNEKGIPSEGQTLYKDGRLEDAPPKSLIDFCSKQANQVKEQEQEQE